MTPAPAPANWDRLRARLARRLQVERAGADQGDEICAFFLEAYRDQPTAYAFEDPVHVRRHWEWINEHRGVAWLCRRDGRIIGHFAATRADAAVGGTLVPIRWGRDLIVAPDERQAGVGPFLILSAVEDEPTPFFIAGLNDDVYPIYQRLGFTDLGRIPLYLKVYEPERLFATLPWRPAKRLGAALLVRGHRLVPRRRVREALTLDTVQQFDRRFDAFWSRVEEATPAVVRRTSESMTWRYARHPDHRYTTLAASDGDRLRGLVIVRHGRSRGLPVGIIVELLTEPGDRRALSFLIDAAERLLVSTAREPLAFLRCAVRDTAQTAALASAGFLRAPSPMHFMVTAVQGHPQEPYLVRHDDWFINSGDSDLDAL